MRPRSNTPTISADPILKMPDIASCSDLFARSRAARVIGAPRPGISQMVCRGRKGNIARSEGQELCGVQGGGRRRARETGATVLSPFLRRHSRLGDLSPPMDTKVRAMLV